jgi:acyl-CoA thioesterase-1
VLQSLGRNPDLAIVALGANDMLRGQPVAAAYANLDAILAEFDRRRVPVILAGMRAAPNLGADYRRAFDAIYPALAKKHRAILYPFFLEGVAAQPSLQLADGMHPNRAGVARMVAGMEPLVRRALVGKQP